MYDRDARRSSLLTIYTFTCYDPIKRFFALMIALFNTVFRIYNSCFTYSQLNIIWSCSPNFITIERSYVERSNLSNCTDWGKVNVVRNLLIVQSIIQLIVLECNQEAGLSNLLYSLKYQVVLNLLNNFGNSSLTRSISKSAFDSQFVACTFWPNSHAHAHTHTIYHSQWMMLTR